MTAEELLVCEPLRPRLAEIAAYRTKHNCGVYTARDVLNAKYRDAQLAWLVEAVKLLLLEHSR